MQAILARILNGPVDGADLDQMLNTLSSCGLVYEPVIGTWNFTSVFVVRTFCGDESRDAHYLHC